MLETKTHPACTIHEDGMRLPLCLDLKKKKKGHIHKNITKNGETHSYNCECRRKIRAVHRDVKSTNWFPFPHVPWWRQGRKGCRCECVCVCPCMCLYKSLQFPVTCQLLPSLLSSTFYILEGVHVVFNSKSRSKISMCISLSSD